MPPPLKPVRHPPESRRRAPLPPPNHRRRDSGLQRLAIDLGGAFNRALYQQRLGRWLRDRLDAGRVFETVELRLARGGAGLDGLRVAFLSDLHVGCFLMEEDLARLCARVAEAEPDLVCLGGDLVHARPDDVDRIGEALAPLRPRLGIYAVPGNHDLYADPELSRWRPFLEKRGVTVLLNEGRRIEVDRKEADSSRPTRSEAPAERSAGSRRAEADSSRPTRSEAPAERSAGSRRAEADSSRPTRSEAPAAQGRRPREKNGTGSCRASSLWLAGVDDLGHGQPDLPAALDGVREAEPVLLLSHHPDVFWEAASVGVDLTLSGHTHAGQITLFGRAFTRHTRLGFWRGRFEMDGAQLYVGRGAGTSGLPLRVQAPAELSLITLRTSV